MRKFAKSVTTLTVILCSWSTGAQAAGETVVTGPWANSGGAGGSPLVIAQSSGALAASARNDKKGSDEDLPWYSKNRMHKYLGLGSMGLALATLAAPKEEDGAHEKLAKAAAVLGGAAVANGIYAHWDDMEFTWDDPDTRHALFGALGTLGYLLAVAKGGEGGHAAMGGLGAIAMAYSIKISW